MNAIRFALLSSLLFGATGVSQLLAAGESSASTVALVDITHIFSKHERYKQRMEALGAKVQTLQKELVSNEQALAKKREGLREFKLGSPDFKRLEEEIAHEISDHHVAKQIKQKETREEEARIHYEVYTEIVAEVERLAMGAGCRLVLRYDSQAIDKGNPGAVQNGILRPVVYCDADLDMTEAVIKELNQRVARGPAPPSGGTTKPKKTQPR